MIESRHRLLFDECISHWPVEFISRHFAHLPNLELQHIRKIGWSGLPDEQWILQAVSSGFSIVTVDRNEQTRRITDSEVERLGGKMLLLGKFFDNLGAWERSRWLVNHVEDLFGASQKMTPGVALIDRFGKPNLGKL